MPTEVIVSNDVVADLDAEEKRIEVRFDYHPDRVKKIKKVPGARWKPDLKAWWCPKDTTTGRWLRDEFGDDLRLGPKLMKWGREAVTKENELKALSVADDAELEYLNRTDPKFHNWLHPYQRAGALLMSQTSVINADQPGLGKTAQTIASITERWEGGGFNLVVAPKTSLDVVWAEALEEHCHLPYLTMSGDDSTAERAEILSCVEDFVKEEQPFYLVVNPAFIRYERDKDADMIIVRGKRVHPWKAAFPEFFDIPWDSITFDEYHKMGLSNDKTNMFHAANDLKAKHKLLLSGTPMGGKPIKLWGALHFLDPDSFTSKWRWADQWLTVDEGYSGHKSIEGVRTEREEAFWEHLKPYMVRRTKAEVLKDLPPKQYVDIWCDMTPSQEKQYKTFAENAEIKIEEENLSATGILAEYMRLKQFAGARQLAGKFDDTIKVTPTTDSGKLPHILRLLEERGISGKADDAEGDEQVVIFSQFSTIVDMVHKWLNEDQGIKAAKITGKVSQAQRTELVKQFQAGEVRVMVVTTTAAGVALTLDKASTAIILDETWNPDDQEQAEDRVHRASRIHQVTVYYLRSKNTIEEYIKKVTMGKMVTNQNILDLRRQGLKAIGS